MSDTTRGVDDLSIAILEMVADGYNNREIGAKLYLSQDTVKTRIVRLRQRIGAKDRAHAVRRGVELGLISCTDGVRAENVALHAELTRVYRALAAANEQIRTHGRQVQAHPFSQYLLNMGQVA